MNFILAAGGLAFLLFIFSYIRQGRFGTTVLALSAGYLLATMWGDKLMVYDFISLPFMSWRDGVYLVLVLLPGVLALLFSPKQSGPIPRILGAVFIATLGVALLLPLFASESPAQDVYGAMQQYRETIIAALIALGLLDMVFSRSTKAAKHHSKD